MGGRAVGGDPQSLSNLPALTMTSSLGLQCDYRYQTRRSVGKEKNWGPEVAQYVVVVLTIPAFPAAPTVPQTQSLQPTARPAECNWLRTPHGPKAENPGEVSGRPALSHTYPLAPVPSPSLGSCWDKCLGSVG